MSQPITVEVTRGHHVESTHLVDAVIVNSSGIVIKSWGEPQRHVLPRSALKPIQATPLVTSGVADGTSLSSDRLAIACSSHNGEHEHVRVVQDWLEGIGCLVADLECGAHYPSDPESSILLRMSGQKPDARHNNCSGKHTGFLALSKFHGFNSQNYLHPHHELQTKHVTPAIEDFCRISLRNETPAIDGCGIPAWSIPIAALATGWAHMQNRGSGRRLLQAMIDRPFLIAGTNRACTTLMIKSAGRAAVKTGAEGVFCGVEVKSGHAFALKTRDGNSRASEAVAAWMLDHLGAIEHAAPTELQNWAGTNVGEVRVAPNT
ncbi:MAG TPA: asparaginase [Acidimicrobiaceae bacterium]|nr:asparaginase [Actinomycetota bacterium]HAN08885.1 asparaginase [Acidimicrobiaceae bacterium]